MNKRRPRFLRDPNDLFDGQIGLNRSQPLTDVIAFIRLEPMQGQLVLFRIQRNGAKTQFRGGPHHADGNFAAIGDQNLLGRIGFLRRHGVPLNNAYSCKLLHLIGVVCNCERKHSTIKKTPSYGARRPSLSYPCACIASPAICQKVSCWAGVMSRCHCAATPRRKKLLLSV